jgi:hypothetical protein
LVDVDVFVNSQLSSLTPLTPLTPLTSVNVIVPKIFVPKIVPAVEDEPYNHYHGENKKADKTGALEDVPEHHLGEKPVAETSVDMLCHPCVEIEDVDGAYTPGVVVGILPVEQAILPIPARIPPFTCCVTVLFGITGYKCVISPVSGIVVDITGCSYAIIENFT